MSWSSWTQKLGMFYEDYETPLLWDIEDCERVHVFFYRKGAEEKYFASRLKISIFYEKKQLQEDTVRLLF